MIYFVGGCVSVALLDAKLQPWANISDGMKDTFESGSSSDKEQNRLKLQQNEDQKKNEFF